jgi:hypothetical protein
MSTAAWCSGASWPDIIYVDMGLVVTGDTLVAVWVVADDVPCVNKARQISENAEKEIDKGIG